ncbi:MAG: hypothetical protein B6I20_02650 [Bacteroidetes bacterium 4572_117]|nr:MAG: hypothetical protein B6I20_02650 [Bacteroidetes bacterium 4572_117]
MIELFEFSFSSINIIPTVLLVFVVLYWLVVLMGLVSMSSIDFDVDTDVDVDADIHIDADVDVDTDLHLDANAHVDADIGTDIGHGGPGIMLQGLLFFNVGKVPFLILLSFFVIPLWFISLIVNYYLNVDSVALSLLFLIPESIVSLFIAKLISTPIAGLFIKIDNETGKPEDFTGIQAVVRIKVEKERDGQIELVRNNSTVILPARSVSGDINQGTEILIIDYIEDKNYYLVEPF